MANILSKLSVTKKKSHQRSVIQIWQRHLSVSETECLAIDKAETETNNWMTPIIQYLEDGTSKLEQEKSDETIVCPVHHDQRRLVPKRIFDPPAEMHHQHTGLVYFSRDP